MNFAKLSINPVSSARQKAIVEKSDPEIQEAIRLLERWSRSNAEHKAGKFSIFRFSIARIGQLHQGLDIA
jgi:hypothetical protein